LVAVATAAGLIFVARRRTPGDTYDFREALKQLEEEHSLMRWSWSYRLRNAALLRYYALMRALCSKLGVQDDPAETPKEFIDKATRVLKIEPREARQFADAFNRARYGLELSENEAREAASFMGRFVDDLRRSLNLGS
jgi:hypothetical protein